MNFSNFNASGCCSRSTGSTSTACDDELLSDSFEDIPEMLQGRLRDMQELVCYLLRKNQELRMERFAYGDSSLDSNSPATRRE